MKRISFQLRVIGAGCLTATLSVSMFIYLFMCMNNRILAVAALITAAIDLNLLRLFCQRIHALFRARLIVESYLFHIVSAKTNDKNSVDIYFSSFGILLCDSVVAFEPEKLVLRAVIHKEGMVTIIYENEGIEKEVIISGLSLSAKELKNFKEKLEYETGIQLTQ